MDINIVYIVTSNKDEALKIGEVLVKEKLAACINIIDRIGSIFFWEGKLNKDNQEAILIAKTSVANNEKVIARVKALHSYSCPCIVALPITTGNPDYLTWVRENCKS